jgi:glycosyltransferase involved in cell wall biosynthesis
LFYKIYFHITIPSKLQIRNTLRKKIIYYWSPFLSPIATCKAVINSAGSLMQFGTNYQSFILNFFGEFNQFDQEIKKKKIKFIGFYNLYIAKFLPYKGKIKSRFSFFMIFLLGFFPLIKILKENKPDFLIIHLITSLPLILLLFFNFDTKFILRISGYPRMNFFRKFLWKLAFKKIYKVTCPTQSTLSYIKSLNIISDNKVGLLYDPIINVAEINIKKKKIIHQNKDYFLAVGRLTKQKDFVFLCRAFKEIIKKNKNIKVLIAGTGEDKKKISKYLKINNLDQNISLIGHIENIFPYFVNAKAFILTSLWEDPGFVLVEAAFSRTLILTNNSKPGPDELIKNNYNGIVYKQGDINDFQLKFDKILNLKNINTLKINSLKSIKKFTLFSHYRQIKNLILDGAL